MPMTMASGVLISVTSGRESACRMLLMMPFFSRMVCQAIVVRSEFIQSGKRNSRKISSMRPRLICCRIMQSGYASTRQMRVLMSASSTERPRACRYSSCTASQRFASVKAPCPSVRPW